MAAAPIAVGGDGIGGATSTSGSSIDEPLRSLLHALPAGTLLLLERLDCGGAFLLPLLVRAALEPGAGGYGGGGGGGHHKVLVVAAAHSPARHAAALRRLGLAQQLQRRDVAFVAAAATATTETAATALQLLARRVSEEARALLESPCAAAYEAAGAGGSRGGLTVILDSLVALQSLFPDDIDVGSSSGGGGGGGIGGGGGGGVRGADAFVHFCRSLGSALGAEDRCRFVLLAAADVPGGARPLAALRHAADAVAELSPVEGRTAGLDGRLRVELRRRRGGAAGHWLDPSAAAAADGARVWHFRVGDVGVRWLPEQIEGRELMA